MTAVIVSTPALIDSRSRGHSDYDYFSFAQDEFYIYILFLWFGDV